MSDLFSKRVIVGGEVMLSTNFMDLPGEHHIGGIWKHHPLNNLAFTEPPPGVYPEPTNPGRPLLMNSYTLYYGGDQYLVQYSGKKYGVGVVRPCLNQRWQSDSGSILFERGYWRR